MYEVKKEIFKLVVLYIYLIAESAVTLSGRTGSMNAGCVCTAQTIRHMTATRKCLPLQHSAFPRCCMACHHTTAS